MKKLLAIILSAVGLSAYAANQATPLTTNKAAAYATTGTAPVFNGTQWVFVPTNAFGSGAGTTNLTPWTSDINAAGHSLTNAGTVAGTNFVGNASGLTNLPGSGLQSPLTVSDLNVSNLTATNVFLNLRHSTNAPALFTTNNDPNCLVYDAGVAAQWVYTNASFTITGFSNTVAGYFSLISVTMSNSAAAGTNITVTAPAGATAASNGSSTNALVINQGKQGVWSFWINPGHWTNYVNLVF